MVSVEADKIPEVAQQLAELNGVSEVYSVAGDADLIAIVRVREFDQIAETIAGRLSKVDGVVHWRGSVQHPGDNPQTENIEVFASHIGLGVNPAVMFAIADRLAQPEGEWKPFQATGCAAFAFPKTTLN